MKVPNKNQEAVRNINCPRCKRMIIVSFLQDAPIDINKQVGLGSDDDTVYIKPSVGNRVTPYLVAGGMRYDITKKVSIIGREARTSTADIQIPTNDLYMGRQHAVITRTSDTPNGYMFTISDYSSKNGLKVDGKLVCGDMQMPLSDGSCIKMGNTTLIFKTT